MKKPKESSLTESEKKLIEHLRRHPDLFKRLASITELSEGNAGTIVNANELERLLIDEIRQLGSTTMHEWACHTEACVGDRFARENPGSYSGKKNG